MAVLRELSQEITRAIGIPELEVSHWSRSSANVVLLMRGAQQAFFAKIYTDGDPEKLDANTRYDREKSILSRKWPVGMPKMVYSADVERVIVTREVPGYGFKHYLDRGEAMKALGMMAEWVAGFHASAEARPQPGTLWDDFSKYREFRENEGFQALRPLLQARPLREYVLSKGDLMAANFKFNRRGAVAFDFEGVAYRAMEYDLVALVQGLSGITGESVADMVDTVVKQYASVRPIADEEATKEVIAKVVEAVDY